jgi:hypothetical protein
MSEILVAFLTIYGIWAILYTVKKNQKKSLPKIKYSQTRIHNIISNLLPEGIEIKRVSQTTKLKEKNTFRVLVIGPTAYWVNNNVFYQADVDGGEVNRESARAINFTDMDQKEVVKMLDILDHLKNGKRNEGRSTGNQ